MRCPKCKATTGIRTERRPNGNSLCGTCKHMGKTSTFVEPPMVGQEIPEMKRFIIVERVNLDWGLWEYKLCIMADTQDEVNLWLSNNKGDHYVYEGVKQ